jgi:hypothetical protein
MSSDWIKGASQCGFICESSEITSTATSGKVADFRIREEQRELQGLKSKSGGTEILMSPKTKFTKWECPEEGWEVWEPPDTTLEAGAHRILACGAYATPSKKVYSVPGHEGPMGTIWPIIDQQSGFDGGWKAWHEIYWHVLVARLPPGDQGVNARATGEVVAAEQSSNNEKEMWKTLFKSLQN